jgi:mannose-6-phosphate isomerase-like protein (cupin superfamily)
VNKTPNSRSAGQSDRSGVERIYWGDTCLAYIIRASFLPDETTFLTAAEFKQQVGFIVYSEGGRIQRHVHRPIERHIQGTSEVLVVRKGRCKIDIYNDEKELVVTRELRVGDVMLMVNGGHGFRMVEDTVFLEIKQGPYIGLDEKERF